MTPIQLKMARAALELSVDQLASKAGISHVDVQALESGGSVGGEVEQKAKVALESGGIEWIDADGVRFVGAIGSATIATENLNSYNDE